MAKIRNQYNQEAGFHRSWLIWKIFNTFDVEYFMYLTSFQFYHINLQFIIVNTRFFNPNGNQCGSQTYHTPSDQDLLGSPKRISPLSAEQ